VTEEEIGTSCEQSDENGGSELEIDRGGGEEGLNAHIVEATPDSAGEAIPSLGFAVDTFDAPGIM
jgi:hypothetical protein